MPRPIAVAVALAGCSAQPTPVTSPAPSNTTPSPPPPSPPPAPAPRSSEITDTYGNVPLVYQWTAPDSGTLTAKLSWDPAPNGARLMLKIGETSFYANAPDWSPVLAGIPVVKGQTYYITVDEGHAPWDYHFNDPFVLTLVLR